MSSLFDNADNLRLLQNLLNPQQRNREEAAYDELDSENEDTAEGGRTKNLRSNLNPANIGPMKSVPEQEQKKREKEKPKDDEAKPPIKTIEEWQELQEKEDAELLETRKRPEFKMTYRQAVGTEDVFLQMGNRSSASASCEDLMLVIDLPEETVSAERMELSITDSEVDLATPIYRLKMPLPHRVNVDRCSAKYDANEKRMCLKLRLQRELDFINF